MINLSNLTLTLQQIIGETELVLLGSRPWYVYENGIATQEVCGTVYDVVAIGGSYDKFNVKVPDTDTAITLEDIKSAQAPIKVEFENAVCKLYKDRNGHIQVSVKAESINVL